MKQLISIIKGQIQQLPIPDLKHLLLSHLKEDAHDLTELFCQQIPAQKNQFSLNHSVPFGLPASLSVLAIVLTYAPNLLHRELSEQLLTMLDSIKETKTSVDNQLAERCTKQLNYYSDAKPVLIALKERGAKDLIQILEQADERSLSAFSHLAKDTDLNVLIETFLVKNNKDLDLVNRNHLVQFLRQPDLAGWLTRFLDSLTDESINALSIRLLLSLVSSEKAIEKLKEARACLAQYPFSIDLHAMRAVFDFYQYELKRDLFSPESHLVMQLLHDLLKNTKLDKQQEFFQGLSQETVLLIIEYCIAEYNKTTGEEKQNCKNLLTRLCSAFSDSSQDFLGEIRTKFNQLDPYLFDTPQLYQLASDLITKSCNSGKEPLSSSPIALLLSMPQFVGVCTPKVLKQLVERYSLYTLTLSQKDYKQDLCFKEYAPYFDEINEHMAQIERNLLIHPEAQSFWLDKKYSLLQFRVEISKSALLHQMECLLEANKGGDELHNKGLEVLYHYYALSYPNLRSDLFLKVVNHIYSRFFIKGNNETEVRNGLFHWLRQSFPLIDKLPKELDRKKEIFLYNSAGKKIGFLGESNAAMTFVNEEIVLLARTGSMDINEPLYDQEGLVLGYLTEESCLRSESAIHKNAAAWVLAGLSKSDLESSSFGLESLLHNVLFENAIGVLYQCESICLDANKRIWLNNKLLKEIQEAPGEIPASVLYPLLDHFEDETVFELLGAIRNKNNALELFHYILNQDPKRSILLNGLYESDFQRFLEHQGADVCLADYLVNYYDKPWFSEVLLRFAYHGKKYKKPDLLSSALTFITKEISQDKKQETICDAVLDRLINSEACAALVLKEFLGDRTHNSIQKVNNPEIGKVSQFFDRRHIMPLIAQLNKTSYWEQNAQYKLALHILANQHGRLFSETDLNPDSPQAWQGKELKELACFTSRHLSKKRPFDNKHDIGYRVLGELLFRCANSGITSLFYKHKALNRAITRLSITEPFLVRMVDKLWMPKGIRELYGKSLFFKGSWFDDQVFLQKELKDHHPLLDWSHFIKQTWSKRDKQKKSPIICSYLLSYKGKKSVLLHLLQDYFNSFQGMPDYIRPVSQLLRFFPQRDVSAVIYDALEAEMIKKPQLLDRQILSDMAFYYGKQLARKDTSFPQADINLLTYWGQNKHYSLAKRGCELLARDCEDKGVKKRLVSAAKEAEVEQDLSSSVQTFYFGLIKFFKRLWHYGFNAENSSSKIIKFCDDPTPGPTRKKAGDFINAPVAESRTNSLHLGFSERRKQLISLLATIKSSPAHFTRVVNYSDNTQTFFGEQPKQSIDYNTPAIPSNFESIM
ncbi:Dot/Icm T4SS effector Lem1 [Legionella pneumophila serogroup 10]